MLAGHLISDSIPPVKPSDRIGTVLNWMNEFKVGHLPIVQNGELKGILSEDDILESGLELEDGHVSQIERVLPPTLFVLEESHAFDALKLMAAYKLHVLPVLDAMKNYVGIITRGDLVNFLGDSLGVKEPGGIIVLEVQYNSYSLSEIGRICESCDAKVLSLILSPSPDHSTLVVTLKLNIRELSRVISTFERFEYKISAVVFDTEQLNDFREDYENLLRYLNI